jgi:hypothetical protein
MKQILDQFLAGYITPVLTNAGFKKKNLWYTRDIGEIKQALVFEKSHGNDDQQCELYVSLGLFSPKLSDAEPKNIYDYHVDSRVEDIFDSFQGDSIIIKKKDNIEFQGKQQAAFLETEVIPFFDKYSNTDLVVKFMVENNRLHQFEELVKFLSNNNETILLGDYIGNLKDLLKDDDRLDFFLQEIEDIKSSSSKN